MSNPVDYNEFKNSNAGRSNLQNPNFITEQQNQENTGVLQEVFRGP